MGLSLFWKTPFATRLSNAPFSLIRGLIGLNGRIVLQHVVTSPDKNPTSIKIKYFFFFQGKGFTMRKRTCLTQSECEGSSYELNTCVNENPSN